MNGSLDRELNVRFIIVFAVVLTLVTVGMAALMWGTSSLLRGRLADLDPPPPTLPAARVQPLPPEPRLQARPEDDMAEMRAEENLLLSTYDWVDEGSGIARIPIDAAIELMSSETGHLQSEPVPEEADN